MILFFVSVRPYLKGNRLFNSAPSALSNRDVNVGEKVGKGGAGFIKFSGGKVKWNREFTDRYDKTLSSSASRLRLLFLALEASPSQSVELTFPTEIL